MINTHFMQTDLTKIKNRLQHLNAAYVELRAHGANNSHHETLKGGFLVDAGKSTEAILKFICKRENLKPAARMNGGKADENRNPSLNDYIFMVREHKIISDDIYHHLDIIKRWRNRSAHDTYTELNITDSIRSSTIESVHDSFHYFITWFYQMYLKDEVPDFTSTPKLQDNSDQIAESATVPSEEENSADQSQPFTGKPESAEQTRSKFRILKFTGILIIAALLLGVAWLFFDLTGSGINTDAQKKSMTQTEAYDFIAGYFSARESSAFDAREYFIDTVQQYYNKYRLTPEQIEKELLWKDSEVQTNFIDKSSLTVSNRVGSITYWQFQIDITYFLRTDSRYHKMHNLTEFGINADRKITSIRSLESVVVY